MRLHRFITNFEITGKDIVVKDEGIIHQIKSVLRLKEGDLIQICQNGAEEYEVIIKEVSKESLDLEIIKEVTPRTPPLNEVHLYVSIIKKDNFELLSQKCVECGVSSITPIITERTIKTNISQERIKKIMHEATEQSGQNKIPKLNRAMSFSEAISEARKNDFDILIADTKAEKNDSQTIQNKIALFIGPEGGFSEKEIEEARSKGAKAISLGGNILRAETAAIVGVWKFAWGKNY